MSLKILMVTKISLQQLPFLFCHLHSNVLKLCQKCHQSALETSSTSYQYKLLKLYFSWLLTFLPRDASAERGNATVSRPSVCPSVRPSVCL